MVIFNGYVSHNQMVAPNEFPLSLPGGTGISALGTTVKQAGSFASDKARVMKTVNGKSLEGHPKAMYSWWSSQERQIKHVKLPMP